MSDAANPTPVAPDPPPMPPPRNNWGWIAFFVFVFVAAIAVAVTMIVVNLRMQLKPDRLEAAWKLWKDASIKNYNMVYTEKHSPDDKITTFNVKVRGGIVTEVLMNGKPLQKNAEQTDDPLIYHSMDSQFRMIQRFMDIDSKPGADKVYVTSSFDDETGRLGRYIRRVMTSGQRVEIEVKKFERADIR
jgi:hypothetical protein